MYTVLSGAKKNVGDYLITDRCKKLLKRHKSNHELFQLPHWKSFEDSIEKVNKSKAIILMGGPGFQPHFYPGVYKLMSNLSYIDPPIIPMGLGWKGFPGDYNTIKYYKFNSKSKKLLNQINNETKYISCRDYMTKEILKRNGLKNILMTGGPAWYDLDSIGKKFEPPKEVNNIVFTPAQKHIYRNQSINCLKLIKNIFPNEKLYCVFHRGITANDKYTPKSDEKNNLIIKKAAEKLNYEIIDGSFDLDNINFYDKCDLHIGYRVHGHIYFLSKRKPSFLLHEDGRGKGASHAFNIRGIDAYKRNNFSTLVEMNIPKLSGLVRKMFGGLEISKNAIKILEQYLNNELENNFARFIGIGKIIDRHYSFMKKFIKSLPE